MSGRARYWDYLCGVVSDNPGVSGYDAVRILSAAFGLREETAREIVREAVKMGLLVEKGGKLWPRQRDEHAGKKAGILPIPGDSDDRLEAHLLNLLDEAMARNGARSAAAAVEMIEEAPAPAGEAYLVVWDVDMDRADPGVRRTLYRKLQKAIAAINRGGRTTRWLQKSVMLCETKQDALLIAGIFEAWGKVSIFKVLPEKKM